jgi:hypothetical protein
MHAEARPPNWNIHFDFLTSIQYKPNPLINSRVRHECVAANATMAPSACEQQTLPCGRSQVNSEQGQMTGPQLIPAAENKRLLNSSSGSELMPS